MERNSWSKSSTILPLFPSERSFDLLVDTRNKFYVFFFTVTCIWGGGTWITKTWQTIVFRGNKRLVWYHSENYCNKRKFGSTTQLIVLSFSMVHIHSRGNCSVFWDTSTIWFHVWKKGIILILEIRQATVFTRVGK